VILHKGSKERGIQAIRFHFINAVDKVANATTRRFKCLCDPVVPEHIVSDHNCK
jgi:hypothetical protein